ncbi:MAG: selenide, water dikinase SelD [Phycisphaerales bacterium]|nr:selenide, water dikinase SelD [Phycisphaerales bacterium]
MLRQLQPPRHPDLLVGIDTLDDAGVFRIAPDLALVQTVDFFPPLVDDPYAFGQIAAANALSDVYAMGGMPLTALNLVGFPLGDAPEEWLAGILKGGSDKVVEAGATIVGGHSVRDAEIKYGLAITGRVHPEHILTNAHAHPGDTLLLTKPLGNGVLTSAAKKGLLGAVELEEAIRWMTLLNRDASFVATRVGAHACTDVTGFGLIGHAYEIAQASDVTLVIDASWAPLLNRTLEFARQGLITRAAKSTREYLGDQLRIEGDVEPALASVLLDAQTSGGLLLSIASDRTERFVDVAMDEFGFEPHVIGRVEPRGSAAIVLRP